MVRPDFADNEDTATTTWNYNTYRGWLDNKRYAGTIGPDYTYTAGGRLKTRTWARTGTGGQRIVTTYKYGFDDTPTGNEHGELTEVSYQNDPQNTPTVTYTYDRLGRQSTIVQGGMTTTKTYNDASQQLAEAYTGGTLAGLTVTSGYDNYLRRTSLSLNTQPSSLNFSYAYDTASRLQTVTDSTGSPTYSATYAYLANSPLVSTVTFKQGTDLRMTTTKQYDFLNRLTAIQTLNSQPATINSFSYTYNDANQRTRATLGDLSYWIYGYDSLGQVKSGKRYWFNGTPVAGQQFEYGLDDIGNRTQTEAGGDDSGAGLRPANYSANNLNQYTSRDVPGYVDVMGISFATNSVTVNSQTAYRKGEYFRKELPVGNGSSSLWTNIIVAATGQTSVTGNLFVAKSPETFGYDPDGNMTNDGRWSLTWDSENRLTKAESLSSGPLASKRKVVWEFDCRGRRIRQTTSDGSSGSYVVTEDLKFLSDGWRHIAELNATNNVLVRSYVWGLDLSETMDGAGGVGGLLMLNSVANGAHFYAYDGNGNVIALGKGSDGAAGANYEYDPFGQVLRATGPMANDNRFQFSTKRCERTTDFVLFESRLYSPGMGRWLNRDSLDEDAGPNLYCGIQNDPINQIDLLGQKVIRMGFGFDWSVKRTKELELYALLDSQVAFLQKMVDYCVHRNVCGCTYWEDVRVWEVHDYWRDKPAPWDGDYGGDHADRILAVANLNAVRFGDVHVVVTGCSIDRSAANPRGAFGETIPRAGILFSHTSGPPAETLAHEVGHVVGYEGNAPDGIHSTDTENVMRQYGTANEPHEVDCQWCFKVMSLAH